MADVLKEALEAGRKNNISTLVVASTSGKTADRLFELAKGQRFKIIVVTHDEGKPEPQHRFSQDIRRKLLANNVTVYTHNQRFIFTRKVINKLFGRFGFPRWYRHLQEAKQKYGTGIKVCHIITQMLMEGRVLGDGRLIAIAGNKSGADSCGVFSVRPGSRWPVLEEVIIREGTCAG